MYSDVVTPSEALFRFQWVYCQTNALKSCVRENAVREKLEMLPEDLADTYTQMIKGIPEEHIEDAFVALRWLLLSGRHRRSPLTGR